MYVFFSILLVIAFAVLTVAGETKRFGTRIRALFWINLGISAAGVLLAAVTFFCARSAVFGGGFDAEFTEWAWDMLAVYYRLSMIPFAAFLAISALAGLTAVLEGEKKHGRYGLTSSVKLRLFLAVTVVFSAVMLLLAPLYAFMTVNENVPLERYVLLTGFAEALAMRAPLLIVYGSRMRARKRENVTKT